MRPPPSNAADTTVQRDNAAPAGPLLGSGSFGRVYAARWRDADVAVKIIPCRKAELQRVLQEAQTMLRLRHANVVGALTYAVVTSPQPPLHDNVGVSVLRGGVAVFSS